MGEIFVLCRGSTMKINVFLILSMGLIFSAICAQKQVKETKRLRLAYVLPLSYQLKLDADGNQAWPGYNFAQWSSNSRHIIISGGSIGSGPHFCDVPMKVIDAKTGTLLTSFSDSRFLNFSPNGQYFSVAFAQRVQIHDARSGECIRTVNEKLLGPSVHWSPDSKLLLIFEHVLFENYDSKLILYDVKSGEISVFDHHTVYFVNDFEATLRNHCRNTSSVSWSPNSQNFATYNNNNVFVWSINSKMPVRIFKHKNGSLLQWSVDGRYLTSVSFNNEQNCAKLWDVFTGELVHSKDIRSDSRKKMIMAAATMPCSEWSPDRKHLLTQSDSEGIKVWDLV